ncbi:shikimate kinase [Methylomagnum ishizawai]|uniref:Shikimate kinase n=1 Tax=Methylomagnum ishizawai TaxID=1760988 RepID=A0A1Y6D5B9_9GAMM|nr:ATPase [Methylomagnum ishizawai]SMF95742.1 shikimate kinase [Methylomagnum ishizawai]
MKMTPGEFSDWDAKRITLLGMSGVGKTTLADKLPKKTWFHYSGDYRIGTRYLNEPISDNIKRQAMEVPFLRELLRSDSIYIRSNITVDNLVPVSTFLGKLGDPARGGLSLEEFKRRQALHRDAEIRAMRDVPEFIRKVESIYGYRNFINDAGGSVCELDDPDTLEILAEHTLIVYIRTTPELEHMLIERARNDPKPLYYRESFLDEQLPVFMAENGYASIDRMPPDQFVSWVFPKLFHSRLPRYQAIADRYGYTVDAGEIAQVETEADFLALLRDALGR